MNINDEMILSIFISIILSFLTFLSSLFFLDGFKKRFWELYPHLGDTMRKNLCLPQNITNKKIIRFGYFTFATVIYTYLSRNESYALHPLITFVICVFAPICMFIAVVMIMFALTNLFGYIKDVICFLIYVPKTLYIERKQFGLKSILAFFYYLIIVYFIFISIYTLIKLEPNFS